MNLPPTHIYIDAGVLYPFIDAPGWRFLNQLEGGVGSVEGPSSQ